mgnify:CR=1 FL=1
MKQTELKIKSREFLHSLWLKGDQKTAQECVSAEFVYRNPFSAEDKKFEWYIEFVQLIRKSFSNIQFEVEEIIGEGDKVFVSFVLKGIHTNIFFGIPAKRNYLILEVMTLFTFRDGKILNMKSLFDMNSLKSQLSK